MIGFCLPADQQVGPGDTLIAARAHRAARASGAPVVAIVTKTDLVDRARLAEHLLAIDQLGALGRHRPVLGDARRPGRRGGSWSCSSHLPPGPPLYPDGELTDEPEAVMIAELVREAALEGVRDELPHSLAVVVDEMMPRARAGPTSDPLLDVRVNLFVERPSQKAIVIGRGGSRLRDVGTRARPGIEALLGQRVHLDLHVKVAKDWQRDPKQLQRLGF